MNTTLNSGGYLLSRFPMAQIPSQAVDSINIEIRDSLVAASATVRKYQPAWLLTDGTIRSFTDTTKNYLDFEVISGNYYIVLYHRNHIPVISATTQALSSLSALLYDFRTSLDKAYGTNAMKQLAAGVYGLLSGDATGNGQVANTDINNVIRPALGQSGYRNGDINLNGQVQNSDMNTYTRPNLGRGSQIPARPVESQGKEE
jgi:hypothetical protein